MSETSVASPRSGSWSLPDTALGRNHTPTQPTGVRLSRAIGTARNGRTLHNEIPCKVIYAGRDVDEIDWWAVRTITDEWILPTDQIVCHYMPANARLTGIGAKQ